MSGNKRKARPPAPSVEKTSAVNTRGEEWQAERLTGKRAQAGRQPSGLPRFSYEVRWKDTGDDVWPNTFEKADNLVGWEKEMKEVDDRILAHADVAPVNLVQRANAARELAAEKRAKQLADHRDRLLRKKRRQQIRSDEDPGPSDNSEDDDLPEGEQLEVELRQLINELHRLGAPVDAAAGETEEAEAPAQSVHKREGRSRVWLAFDRAAGTCKLPHPNDRTKLCGALPGRGSGTSGHRQHLTAVHPTEWAHILKTGEVRTTVQMIEDAFTAKVDETKPELNEEDTDELHRLVALWVAKCGRPQSIVEDAELSTLLARILDLCKSRFRYALPCRQTVTNHLCLLGAEGKELARDFIVRLIKSGVKVNISGDLWSDNGMGLFGIYAHGITETWVIEKALIGLIACEDKVRPSPRSPPRTLVAPFCCWHSLICTLHTTHPDHHVCRCSVTQPKTSSAGPRTR